MPKNFALSIGFSCAAATLPVAGWAQGCGTALPDAQRIESPGYTVAFRTRPSKIRVGEHFSVEFAACPKGQSEVPKGVKVDARMPEHHHGMNYRPTVKKTAGRYVADGLMFHMPGRWELSFELDTGNKKAVLAQSIVVR